MSISQMWNQRGILCAAGKDALGARCMQTVFVGIFYSILPNAECITRTAVGNLLCYCCLVFVTVESCGFGKPTALISEGWPCCVLLIYPELRTSVASAFLSAQ